MVRGRREGRGDSKAFFLRLRDRGVNRVRLGTRGEYEGGEWSLRVKGQAKGVLRRDRSRTNVASSTGEGEEARQGGSLFGSATDLVFGLGGDGSGNNMSELGGVCGGEGVVGSEEAGDGVLESV